MKGVIDKIEKKQTKNNKDYYLLTVDGERYSVWEAKLIKGLSEGDQVEFEWDKSGDFKKMTSLKSTAGGNFTASPTGKYNNNPKSMYFAYGKDIIVALINAEPESWKKKNLESISSAITTIALSLYSASEGERKSPKSDDKDESPKYNDLPNPEDDFEVYKYQLTNTDWQTTAELEDWWNQRQKPMIKFTEEQLAQMPSPQRPKSMS